MYRILIIVDESDVMFAVLDSHGMVTVYDSRAMKKPVYNVNIDMKNTRGDTIQVEVITKSYVMYETLFRHLL